MSMRPAFLGQARLVPSALGQYSWNTYAQPFGASSPVYGASYGAPPPVPVPVEAGARTWDCTNGSDFKNGVDAATAAKLRKDGYICTPTPRPGGMVSIPELPADGGESGGMALPGDVSGSFGMYGRIPTHPIGRFY